MKEPQILIDSMFIHRFISGSDEDRRMIRSFYPDLNFDALRDELLWSIIQKHARNPRRTYPVAWNGQQKTLVVTELRNDNE